MARSRGWSLTGYQAADTSGWPAIMAPSSVCMKPASSVVPGIVNVSGTPW